MSGDSDKPTPSRGIIINIMRTKVTLVNINGKIDLHIGNHLQKRLFIDEKPTLLTYLEVDNVFLNIINDDQFTKE